MRRLLYPSREERLWLGKLESQPIGNTDNSKRGRGLARSYSRRDNTITVKQVKERDLKPQKGDK